jgi:hypothetical protein
MKRNRQRAKGLAIRAIWYLFVTLFSKESIILLVMKYFLVVILLMGFLMCTSNKLSHKTNVLNPNFYTGHAFFVKFFITVSQDTAIADWYYYDGPCQAFSDTLIVDKNGSNIMTGKKSLLCIRSYRNVYFRTIIPYSPPKTVEVLMKLANDEKSTYKQNKHMYMGGNYIR